MISCDFIDTKEGHEIELISFKVKYPNIYTHLHIPTEPGKAMSTSTLTSIACVQYQILLIIGYVVRTFMCSYFDFLNKID